MGSTPRDWTPTVFRRAECGWGWSLRTDIGSQCSFYWVSGRRPSDLQSLIPPASRLPSWDRSLCRAQTPWPASAGGTCVRARAELGSTWASASLPRFPPCPRARHPSLLPASDSAPGAVQRRRTGVSPGAQCRCRRPAYPGWRWRFHPARQLESHCPFKGPRGDGSHSLEKEEGKRNHQTSQLQDLSRRAVSAPPSCSFRRHGPRGHGLCASQRRRKSRKSKSPLRTWGDVLDPEGPLCVTGEHWLLHPPDFLAGVEVREELEECPSFLDFELIIGLKITIHHEKLQACRRVERIVSPCHRQGPE